MTCESLTLDDVYAYFSDRNFSDLPKWEKLGVEAGWRPMSPPYRETYSVPNLAPVHFTDIHNQLLLLGITSIHSLSALLTEIEATALVHLTQFKHYKEGVFIQAIPLNIIQNLLAVKAAGGTADFSTWIASTSINPF